MELISNFLKITYCGVVMEDENRKEKTLGTEKNGFVSHNHIERERLDNSIYSFDGSLRARENRRRSHKKFRGNDR